jgi:aldehyde dehydrogenase (NAD+)
MDYVLTLERQRAYFDSGVTHDLKFRLQQLSQLKCAIQKYETQLYNALSADLGKSEFESYSSEIGLAYREIDYMQQNLNKLVRQKKVKSPLSIFYSQSSIIKVPLGCVLIIAPWNYPFQLLIAPLIGAIAAGNCIVVKPSEISSNTSNVICQMLREFFAEEYLLVAEGDGSQVVPALIEQGSFNHVFFTGSSLVGRQIATYCAQKLIPYTLELGGKSPAIIDKSANLKVAAKRLVWGKLFNCGQTCIAPDYVLIHGDIYTEFVKELLIVAKELGGDNFEQLGRVINQRQFERLVNYLTMGKVIFGGIYDKQTLKISLSILENPLPDSLLMREEIFGPILPLVKYHNDNELFKILKANRYPLALYLFSNNKQLNQKISHEVESGAVGINNCLYHFINHNLPFGGIMSSGNGHYHGKYSFEVFTHSKSVVKSSSFPDLAAKYPPYTKLKLKLLKFLG